MLRCGTTLNNQGKTERNSTQVSCRANTIGEENEGSRRLPTTFFGKMETTGSDSWKVADTRNEDERSIKEPMLMKSEEQSDANNSAVIKEMTHASDGHVESSTYSPDDTTGIIQRPRSRIIRTVMLVLSWVCMGMFSEVTGPTLPYLKKHVNSNYEEIARAMVARSFGFLVGTLSGGFLCEWYATYVDVWLAFSLTIAAIATVVVPWCHSLTLLAALLCTDGFSKGILSVGGNAFMIRMWGLKAAVPVHALHTAFGIGALLAPQVVRPFLGTVPPNISIVEHIDNTSYRVDMSTTMPYQTPTAAIEYPYSIIAAFTVFVAAVFMVLYCSSPIRQEAPKKTSQSYEKRKANFCAWMDGNKRLGYVVLMLVLIICVFPVGMERAYGKFIFSLGVTGPLKLSPANGTLLESAFWASFTAGRLLVTLAATRVRQIFIVLTELFINVAATAALVAYGHTSGPTLAVFSALFAAGMAPLFPSILSWLNLYIEMTALLTCMTFFSCACGAFVYSWMAGYLFQYEGPNALFYFMLASTCACAIVFVPLYFSAVEFVKSSPRRREVYETTVTQDDEIQKEADAPQTKL